MTTKDVISIASHRNSSKNSKPRSYLRSGLFALTPGYTENQHSEVYAYFDSNRFGYDKFRANASLRNRYHGEDLSLWLCPLLENRNFQTDEPTYALAQWSFKCWCGKMVCFIYCESIIPNDLSRWKVTINSADNYIDTEYGGTALLYMGLLKAIRDALNKHSGIHNIEWNRKFLN